MLEKNAEDTKSGTGQYFTPRALIQAMVACVRPQPMRTIADPSCGTGGFFLAAYDYLTDPGNCSLDREAKDFLKFRTFHGWEIVPNTTRLCLMNFFLHNIGNLNSEPPVHRNDSLISDEGERFDLEIMENLEAGLESFIVVAEGLPSSDE